MNKKILSKLVIATVLVGGVNFAPVNFNAENLQIISVAYAEVQNVTASDTAMFDFGEDDAQIVNTVKNVAKMRATQAAKEKAGIYVKTYTKTVNSVLTDDEISAYTSNNIEIVDVKYKKMPYQAHDVKGNDTGKIGFMYEATVTAKIDTSGLTAYIKRDDKAELVEQNKTSEENIAKINKEFDNLRNSSESVEQIKVKLASVHDRMLANEKIDEGNKFYDKKNYQVAISKYTDALNLNPNSSKAYYNRGLCYENLENYSQAIKDYTESIKYSGSNLDAYNNRGNIYVKLKNYEKAIADFSKIISLKSDYVAAYNNRGVVNFYLKNYQQAISDFTQAIKLRPNYKSYYGNRGVVYTKILDYKKALEDLNKAVQLGTTDGEVYFNRGICHKALGNDKQAEKDFSKAADLGYSD